VPPGWKQQVKIANSYANIVNTGKGGGDLAPPPDRPQRLPAQGCRPSSRDAPLLPLGPAGMFSILAPSPELNKMGQSKRFRDFCLLSGKVSLQITSLVRCSSRKWGRWQQHHLGFPPCNSWLWTRHARNTVDKKKWKSSPTWTCKINTLCMPAVVIIFAFLQPNITVCNKRKTDRQTHAWYADRQTGMTPQQKTNITN
jgi:hypothetical protein